MQNDKKPAKTSWKIKLTPFGAFEFNKKNREDIKKTNLDD